MKKSENILNCFKATSESSSGFLKRSNWIAVVKTRSWLNAYYFISSKSKFFWPILDILIVTIHSWLSFFGWLYNAFSRWYFSIVIYSSKYSQMDVYFYSFLLQCQTKRFLSFAGINLRTSGDVMQFLIAMDRSQTVNILFDESHGTPNYYPTRLLCAMCFNFIAFESRKR